MRRITYTRTDTYEAIVTDQDAAADNITDTLAAYEDDHAVEFFGCVRTIEDDTPA